MEHTDTLSPSTYTLPNGVAIKGNFKPEYMEILSE